MGEPYFHLKGFLFWVKEREVLRSWGKIEWAKRLFICQLTFQQFQ